MFQLFGSLWQSCEAAVASALRRLGGREQPAITRAATVLLLPAMIMLGVVLPLVTFLVALASVLTGFALAAATPFVVWLAWE